MDAQWPRGVTACAVLVGSSSLVVSALAGAPALATAAKGGGLTSTRTAMEPVTPQVREVNVPEVNRRGHPRLAARSDVERVDSYGVVGATWLGAPPKGMRLAIRTRTAGRWSRWTLLHGGSCPCAACAAARASAAQTYGGHGPNRGSIEAEGTRSGTDATAIGEVDGVQLRATSREGRVPRDLELSVVDPGTSPADSFTAGATSTLGNLSVASAQGGTGDTSGVRAPRPRIRSRQAWGADESLRSGEPSYGRVKAGFVHHTVNANDYSRADVPAIIRGIYAYHTQSQGWSDIGYNFLVDRFGRIWMGRFGGRRRAVIGAHTYGYNHLSTGVAAIGNFEERRPTLDMQRAFGHLLAWKLGLHGVAAGDREVWLEGSRFRAINGHRDAGQTACPGLYLYRRLVDIRDIAIRRQRR